MSQSMSSGMERLDTTRKKIVYIENIVKEKNGIMPALEDEQNSRASIMMHLTSIAEQFDKLKNDGEFELLSRFEKSDLKGSYDIRNYIVHDYDGLNLAIIESVIRDKLPKIKGIIINL